MISLDPIKTFHVTRPLSCICTSKRVPSHLQISSLISPVLHHSPVKYSSPFPRPAWTLFLFFSFLLPDVFGGLCEIWGSDDGGRDALTAYPRLGNPESPGHESLMRPTSIQSPKRFQVSQISRLQRQGSVQSTSSGEGSSVSSAQAQRHHEIVSELSPEEVSRDEIISVIVLYQRSSNNAKCCHFHRRSGGSTSERWRRTGRPSWGTTL